MISVGLHHHTIHRPCVALWACVCGNDRNRVCHVYRLVVVVVVVDKIYLANLSSPRYVSMCRLLLFPLSFLQQTPFDQAQERPPHAFFPQVSSSPCLSYLRQEVISKSQGSWSPFWPVYSVQVSDGKLSTAV